MLPDIISRLPDEAGTRTTNYIEPFLGGGAVLLEVVRRGLFTTFYAGDLNPALLRAWEDMRDNPEHLRDALSALERDWIGKDVPARKAMYYTYRKRYNDIVREQEISMDTSVLFLFLVNTCFSGYFRHNRNGDMNQTAKTQKIEIFNECVLDDTSRILQQVNLRNCRYQDWLDTIDNRSFVYLDPPYKPTKNSDKQHACVAEGFRDNEQRELADFAREIDRRGGKFLLSNSDTEDGFFEDLYKGFHIERVPVYYTAAAKTCGKRTVQELLIRNY